MPLPSEVKDKIVRYSSRDEHQKLFLYLKEKLGNGEIEAKDILKYAKRTRNKSKTDDRFILNESIINKMGIYIGKLTDKKKKELSVEFYKLAAERRSSWGNKNYAKRLLAKKKKKTALKYARKAVELAAPITDEKYKHHWTLFRVLRANKKRQEANEILMDHFNNIHNKSAEKAIRKKIISQLQTIMKKFENDFKGENLSELTDPRCRENLAELEPILQSSAKNNNFESIKQRAYYVAGKCHEKLGDSSKAWEAYCEVPAKTPSYIEAVEARARLLKAEIDNQVEAWLEANEQEENDTNESSQASSELSEDLSSMEVEESFENDESTSDEDEYESSEQDNSESSTRIYKSPFARYWERNSEWFHSVDVSAMEEKYNQRERKIKELINQDDSESFADVSMANSDEEEVSIQDELVSETEYNPSELIDELKKKYDTHLPNHRKIFRRHMAETRFFEPRRSHTMNKIAGLTKEIIEQRFKVEGYNETPIDLTGKSTRMLISAEKLFQDAVLALNSDKGDPKLGIPKRYGKPWKALSGNYGTTWYGPIELYMAGKTEFCSEHRTKPRSKQRLGDSFFRQLGSYEKSIYPFLCKLTNNEPKKEKKLASFMIRFGQTHKPVTLEKLKAVYNDAEKYDVDRFNQICFMIMEKEQAQWLSATDKAYQLGITVAQARCIIMIRDGFISFKEAFESDESQALFSIYSHKNIIDYPSCVEKSCKYIDDLYLKYLQTQHVGDHMHFFKKHIEEKVPPVCVLTREQAHRDLKEVYGGGSDTDDDGYDTDLSIG